MGKGAPLRWVENLYLQRQLKGSGLEIGALWRRFPVHPSARVVYMDRADPDELRRQFTEVKEKIFLPDLIGDAVEFPIAPGKLDFLIASHVIEHLPFPLAALKAWYEALASGGKLLLKIPDKRFTFDLRRRRTSLAHLIAEHEDPSACDWEAHYSDFVENVYQRKPNRQELNQGAEGLRTGQFNIHFHAWIDEDILEMIEYSQQMLKLDWQARVFWKAHPYRKEVTAVLVKANHSAVLR